MTEKTKLELQAEEIIEDELDYKLTGERECAVCGERHDGEYNRNFCCRRCELEFYAND